MCLLVNRAQGPATDPGLGPARTGTGRRSAPPLPLPRSELPEELLPRQGNRLRRRLVWLDAVIVASAWVWATVPFAASDQRQPSSVVSGAAMATVATLMALAGLHLYRARVCAVRRVARPRLVLAATIAPALAAAAVSLSGDDPRPQLFVARVVAMAAALAVGREVFEQWLRVSRVRGRHLRRVVVAGGLDEVEQVARLLATHPEAGCRLVGWIGEPALARSVEPAMATVPWMGDVGAATSAARLVEASSVLVAPSVAARSDFHEIAHQLHVAGAHVQVWTGLWSVDTRRLRASPMAHEPFFYLEPAGATAGQRWVKRVMDVGVASVLLLLSLPLLVAAAVAIRLGDGGPVLYRQLRVGHRGRTFYLHKFRTMAVDADQRLAELQHANERAGPLFKVTDDPRVTRVGRFLRVTSIDELPQLLDVLRGNLSMVGPRPALPTEVAEFDEELAHRHTVLPGVTGLWQVEARHNPSFDAYRHLDLFYLRNRTLTLDVVILLATVRTVVTDTVRAISGAVTRRLGRDRRAPLVAVARHPVEPVTPEVG